jgi:hypothetical protein
MGSLAGSPVFSEVAMQTTVRRTTVGAEILRWFLFSVVLGLVPLGLRWLLPTLFNRTEPLREVLSNGELLLVGVGLAAAALSDVLSARRGDTIAQLATFGGVLCLFIGAFGYGVISVAVGVDVGGVVTWSVVGFVACLAIGLAGVAIKEAAQ